MDLSKILPLIRPGRSFLGFLLLVGYSGDDRSDRGYDYGRDDDYKEYSYKKYHYCFLS